MSVHPIVLLTPPPVIPAKPFDWRIHSNKNMAIRHAEKMQEMTGDRCEVAVAGPDSSGRTVFRIARYDPSGKRVW
jgi:hypothetical protein